MDDGGFTTAHGTAPAGASAGIPMRSVGLPGQGDALALGQPARAWPMCRFG